MSFFADACKRGIRGPRKARAQANGAQPVMVAESNSLVTTASPPGESVQTARGTVTYLQWLRLEQERMAGHGRKTRLVQIGSLVALERV